jgi:hypothetical protein
MGRPENTSPSVRFEVRLAAQSVELLKEIATRGIYGRTPAEVGGRFIEQVLHGFVEHPKLAARAITRAGRK